MKKKLLFTITQLYKGGAETSLINLLKFLGSNRYDIDLLILNQCPLKNAVSLIPEIPKWINVCDAYSEYQHISIFKRLKGKFIYTLYEKNSYLLPALEFVRGKHYNWAFHIGEWSSPEFVAKQVKSDFKAAWIHNDLSEAEYFNADFYFSFDQYFDFYIFVSENSKRASVKKFPFIRNKSVCIYNISDVQYIKSRSNEIIEENCFNDKIPTLITCANFRKQKNHIRQVKAMVMLKQRGITFQWVNIGATTDLNLYKKVLDATEKYDLEKYFIILGPKENPYKYMKKADAVTVLSDYESWSMVIAEAKILGIPVISTKTSGALEQIEHGKTGLLTDFNATDIADKIEQFLTDKSLQKTIRKNISNFDNTKEILDSFEQLIQKGKPHINETSHGDRILYVIDDINYLGGAHIATKLQIKEFLKEGRDITIFSSSTPNAKVRNELLGVKFLSWSDFEEDRIYNRRLVDCLIDKDLTKKQKVYKMELTFRSKIKKDPNVFDKMVLPNLSKLFSHYDIICVMSEGSAFRQCVANAKCKKKIQWIHTNYCKWKNLNDWNKKITKNDGELYKSFDKIVVLSENIKESFIKLYPHLKDNLIINHNIIPVNEIIQKSQRGCNERSIRFITVGRVDCSKAYDRLFSVLCRLYKNGYHFFWTIVGNGPDFQRINKLYKSSEIGEYVEFKGAMLNPFPEVKKSDVFALLSDYEGLPNTIYEALVLDTPVMATNTGGIKYQIITGETGWLVENDEESIYKAIEHVLTHPDEILEIKKKLSSYHYDNDKVLDIDRRIFFK